jgi:hypothetical protein
MEPFILKDTSNDYSPLLKKQIKMKKLRDQNGQNKILQFLVFLKDQKQNKKRKKELLSNYYKFNNSK